MPIWFRVGPPPFSACVGSVWPSSGLRKVPLTKPGQSRFQSTPNKSTNMAHMVTWHGVQTLVKFMGFYLLHWLPYIALEALALIIIYLFGWPQCIPPGCISFQFVTSNMLTCPNPTREIPNTCNKVEKRWVLQLYTKLFLEFWFCWTFSGFPATILEDQTLFFGLGFPHFWRSTAGLNTVVKLCRLHCCISCGQMYLCLASKGQQSLIHPGKLMAGSQSNGGDFEDDLPFQLDDF